MRLALLLRQPRTILLGSSRVVLSTDETRLKGTVYWPAYNASTYNSGLDHRLSMLRYAAMVDRRLKYLFIELSPLDVIHAPTFWRLEPVTLSVSNILSDVTSLFFSSAALSGTLEVLWTNWYQHASDHPEHFGAPWLVRTGTNLIGLKTLPYSGFVSYGMFPPQAKVDQTWQSSIAKINGTCHEYGLECRLILTPVNARILYGYYYFHEWGEIEALIRQSATIANSYSFLWFNRFTAEPLNSKISFWLDLIHYTTVVGDLIMDTISGKNCAEDESCDNFSTKLDTPSIGSTLAQLRSQRDQWIAGRPDIR